MAALSTYTGTTELTEIVPTELIQDAIDAFEYFDGVAMSVIRKAPGKGSIAVRFPRWNQVNNGSGIPATVVTETNNLTDVYIDMTEESITPGVVGLRLPVSDQLIEGSQVSGIEAQILAETLNGLLDRIEADCLSGSTSATNTTGAITDNFTAAKFRSALAVYRALKIRSAQGHAAILHSDAVRDLEESLESSGASLTPTVAGGIQFGPEAGFRGTYKGMAVFETGNVKDESTGWSNIFTPIGPTCGLGIVISRPPTVESTRGDEGANRLVTFHNVHAWYGAGMTNRRRLLEVLSRT